VIEEAGEKATGFGFWEDGEIIFGAHDIKKGAPFFVLFLMYRVITHASLAGDCKCC